jgi:hypothetical protein
MSAYRESVKSRPLTSNERGILDLLLTQDFQGVDALRAQVPHASVVGRCTCGCATVDLAVDKERCKPASSYGRPILSEAQVVVDDDEPLGGVIVFLDDGYLSALEIYSSGDPIPNWPSGDRVLLALRDA